MAKELDKNKIISGKNSIKNKKRKTKVVKANSFDIWFAKVNFNTRFRIRFYKKLASGMSNGMKLIDIIANLRERYSKKSAKDPRAIAMRRIEVELGVESDLARALKGWAKKEEISVIDIGMKSGSLVQSLELAINMMENSLKVRKTLIKSLTYPAILFSAAIAVLFFIGTFVIPTITESIGNASSWTGTAGSLYSMSLFVQSNKFLYILCGIVFIIILVSKTISSSWGGASIRKYFDKIPPWSVYKNVQGSAFMLSLSAMLMSQVSIHTAIKEIAKNSSDWTKSRVNSIARAQLYGKSGLGDAMEEAGHVFPDEETIEDIKFFQDQSNFEVILSEIGQENMDRSIEKLEAISGRISVLALLSIIGLIVWIVLGVMSIQNQISMQMSI